MSQTKLEFIDRLLKLTSCADDLTAFLVDERLISDQDRQAIRNAVDRPRSLLMTLENLKATDRLLLLDYEWSILPVERMRLTIVTERDKREFVYNF